ncbi:MAG: cytochrome b/b6 domain-containing protein [Mariprofundaceae bacterium]
MRTNRINATTRILHLLMLLTVIYQLFSGLFMEVPEPGKVVGWSYIMFSWHIMFFGWLAFLLASVYAAIRFYEPGQWQRLMPWFSSQGRTAFVKSAKEELPGVFKGKLPLPEKQGALAGAMHGLGFTLLICMGMTGAYVMNGVRSDGSMTQDMMLFLDMHSLFGVLIWAFLIGHVFMVIYHLILGHRHILDIFERVRIRWQ